MRNLSLLSAKLMASISMLSVLHAAVPLNANPEASVALATTSLPSEKPAPIACHPSAEDQLAINLISQAPIDLTKELTSPVASPENKKVLKVKTRNWGKKYEHISNIFGQVEADRANLKALRDRNIAIYKEIATTANPDFSHLMKLITEETKSYIQDILAQEVAKLGAAPCKYSVMSMGSMAREESGIFTDLEIAFLLEKDSPEARRYFNRLSQQLADRIYLLGEHPSIGGKGLRVDEADNSPIHLTFSNRYADPRLAKERLMEAIKKRDFDKIPFEGDRLMIASFEEFAKYSSPFYLDELKERDRHELRELRRKLTRKMFFKDLYNRGNRHLTKKEIYENAVRWVDQMLRPYAGKEQKHIEDLSSLTRNTTHLFGDEDVYKSYLQKREIILDNEPKNKRDMVQTRRQEIAREKLLDDLKKYEADVDGFLAKNELGEKIDLKRQFYRLPEQILTNLGFYYNAPNQNTLEIVEFLKQQGLMSQELVSDVRDLMNFAMGLRLKKQIRLGKQGYAIYLDQEEYEKDLKKLNTELEGLQNVKNLLIKTGESFASIEKVDNKMLELRHKIDDHKKVAPRSIIDAQDIQLMNQKYIPILKRLYQASIDWAAGNQEVFLR